MPSLGDVILFFKADKTDLDQGLKTAEQDADSFTSRVGGKIGDGLKTAFAAGAIGVTGAIAGIGVAAFDMAGQLEGATNQIQAALGLSREDAQAFGDDVKDIFGDNFGTSVEDVTAALLDTRQQMKLLGDEEIKGATENAIRLRDVFGLEVTESTNAANTLMTQFGLTSEQAFDFIAAGQQKGLNSSGDFLDTIGEYSVQFSESGATAEEFFSIMETGMGGGVLGTDKIADAFKENRIRIMEMGDDVVMALNDIADAGPGQELADSFGVAGPFFIDTEEKAKAAQKALADMGLNMSIEELMQPLDVIDEKTGAVTKQAQNFNDIYSSQILGAIKDGSLSVNDAQQLIIGGMNQMDSAVAQNSVGVRLFGTQWEDAGAQAILGLDMAKTGLDDMSGATDTLDAKYNSLGQLLSGTWRNIQVSILAPIGTALLDMANTVIPMVTNGINTLTAAFAEGGGLAGVITVLQGAFNGFRDFFALHSGEILAFFTNTWTAIQGVIDTVIPPIQTVITTIFGAVKTFLDQHGAEILATFQTVWATIQTVVTTAITFIQDYIVPILAAIAGFISAHGAEIQGILTGAWDIIKGIVQGAMDIIQGIVQTVMALISGDWSAAWDGVKLILEGVWTAIQGVITGALEIIQSALSIAWDAIKVAADVIWTGVKEVITGVWDAIYLVISTGLTTIGDAISTAWEAVKTTFTTTWDSIKTAFTNTWNDLKKAVDDVIGPIKTAIESAWNSVSSTTTTIFTGMKNTVTSIWDGIIVALKAPINAVIDAVNMLIEGASAVGEAIGFDPIPTIPRLARGTDYLNFDTPFIAGEKGPEPYRTPTGEVGVFTGGMYRAPRGTKVIPFNKSFGGQQGFSGGGQAGAAMATAIAAAVGDSLKQVMAAISITAAAPALHFQIDGNPDRDMIELLMTRARVETQRVMAEYIARAEAMIASQ